MVTLVTIHRDRYLDSVVLLAATRSMTEADGVSWSTAVMGTPANVEVLVAKGFARAELVGVTSADVVLAVEADSDPSAQTALAAGNDAMFVPRSSEGSRQRVPRSLDAAVMALEGANIAIVSVAGEFAALEAHKALGAGLDVLLFSDNVTIEDEIELKEHAASVGRLLMGPGAGTAVLGGCGLGFANVVKRGRVGVVAAAGTGAQEVMTLLDGWGEGVSQVIGVGGRDLSEQVAGRMARLAVRALDADPNTEIILLVSKPPSLDVARAVVAEATRTPLVASLVGIDDGVCLDGVTALSSTLEGGAAAVIGALGRTVPALGDRLRGDVADAAALLDGGRTLVRGLFSGGTLCYEALTLLQPIVGPVWSNTPLDKRYRVPAPTQSHICLDLGEEEYTKGRPHPMIDPEARIEMLHDVIDDDDVAVVLLDVVLGDGAHHDPASELAPVCAVLTARGGGPFVVVYVLGTAADPQDRGRQIGAFRDAGCIVAPTGARAALAAAALATRRPDLVERTL